MHPQPKMPLKYFICAKGVQKELLFDILLLYPKTLLFL